jgi:hypothetical protein
VEKEAENHSGKEKNRNGDLCKEKKIAFLLEWEKISLDKSLLMGDPFHSQKDQSFGCFTTPARTM